MESITSVQTSSYLESQNCQPSQSVSIPNKKRMDHNDVRVSDEAFEALKEWTLEFVGQKAV